MAEKVENSVEDTFSPQRIRDMVLDELGDRNYELVEGWLDYERVEKGITNECPVAGVIRNA